MWEDSKNCLRRRKTGTRSVSSLGVITGAWSVAEAKLTVVGEVILFKRGRGICADGGCSRSRLSMVEEEGGTRRSPIDGKGWDRRRRTGGVQRSERESIPTIIQSRRRGH